MANEGGVDIATLGLRVDARQLRESVQELGRFTEAGHKAERASDALSQRVQRNARRDSQALSVYRRAMDERRQAEREVIDIAHAEALAMDRMASSTEDVAKKSRLAGAGIHRLNNSMVVMARQATNAHPVVGQLTDVVGTFAIGTAKMVPILAGIAAIGFAWQAMSRKAREAKKELEDNLEILRELAEARDIEARGGRTSVAVAAAQAEAREIANVLRQATGGVLLQGSLGVSSSEPLVKRLRELNELIRAGLIEQEEDAQESRARQRREDLQRRNEVEAAAKAHNDRLLAEAERARRLQVELTRQRWREEGEIIAVAQAERERKNEEFHDKIVALVEETNQRIADEQEKRQKEELDRIRELERARNRALRSLVNALQNVGRAYGGTADQVLALTAAVLSLEKLPGSTLKDQAIGLGTSAALGIGIGRTSGSALLGGFGGAAAGFATFGPLGAVVGGVSGIVSGLVEQGRRARIAEEMWRRTLEDFGELFDQQTPLQRGTGENNRLFLQAADQLGLTGTVTDIESARRFVDAVYGSTQAWALALRPAADELERLIALYDQNADQLREQVELEQRRYQEDLRVRMLRAQGLDAEADKLALIIEQERELARARELGFDAATLALLDEVHAQERLAQATREANSAINSVIQALNAPQGLNLALYQYRLGIISRRENMVTDRNGGGVPDSGIVINGDLNVNVIESGSARDTAREVIREVEREARRGGGDPLLVALR